MKTTSLSLAMALLATHETTPFTPSSLHRTSKRRAATTPLRATTPTHTQHKHSETRLQSSSSRGRSRTNGSSLSNNASSSSSSPPSSALLAGIVTSEQEFELNLGRAVDTLRSDYPNLLSKNPNWEIYHEELDVVDPSGVSLHGLNSYKKAFFFIHGVVKMFYCGEKSALTSIRIGYDWARKCIRVSWNVELVPKMIYGGTRNTLHVDGISEYYLERSTGLINQHKVSHLLINDQTVKPTNGIFNALAEISPVHEPGSVPVFFKNENRNDVLSPLPFQSWNTILPFHSHRTSLFESSNPPLHYDPNNNNLGADAPHYDIDAYQRKNKSRLKFGMPPLTPEEFIKIEEEVRSMEAMNKKKAAYLAEQLSQARIESQKTRDKNNNNFLSNIFGGVLKNGCESNFDCERPEVCCDVGFKKICCSNGLGIVDGMPVEKMERALLRVTIPNDNIDW